MEIFFSKSENDTSAIAADFASKLKGGDVVAFRGGMGMGKTVFVRSCVRALGIDADVSSPTFSIVNDYGGDINVYHFDMYRVESWDSLYSTGFFDYPFEDNVVAVEWSENIADCLPPHTIYVTINRIDDDTREIIIENGGKYASAWN